MTIQGQNTSPVRISCPCLFGLESVLNGEIKRMGGQKIETTDGRVTFEGDLSMVARANINLRTAERVQILLGTFYARSFEELFQGILALPWEQYIGQKDHFPVKGWSLNSQLHSIPDCQSIIKKAVVRRLERCYHISWFEETGATHQIQFAIHKDLVYAMLDTSGEGLHKRGYRKNANAAPIKETLAAGILDLARVYPDSVYYDPFCGSGTFLVEAALQALRIAPGMRRSFAAEKWSVFAPEIWREERQRAMDLIRRDAAFEAYGSDIDPDAVELTQSNAKKAGVGSRIKVHQQDIRDFAISTEKATIVCNPPYGERLLEKEEAEKIYHTMGEVFGHLQGVSCHIISPDEQFESFYGKKADKRRKLYNGMIKCQVYSYLAPRPPRSK